MPFTFSHPAIIIPFCAKKFRLSATGLVIGSLTPDFEYFLRMTNESRYSHTIAGIFFFDLPVGLILAFLWHLVARNALFDNVVLPLKERVIRFKKFNWTAYFLENWVIVFLSIIIGAASHILWDAFTHDTMYFVQRDPELKTVMRLGSINLAGYRFLQLTSSIVGLVIVIVTIFSLKPAMVANKRINAGYWLIFFTIAVLTMTARVLAGLNLWEHRVVLVSCISSVLLALVLTPLVLSAFSRKKERVLQHERIEQS